MLTLREAIARFADGDLWGAPTSISVWVPAEVSSWAGHGTGIE
ncbi:hypothetical protein [Halalkalicoccus salilacus]